jgi:CubicO group peptidase (beta-lactamase class C family)
VSPRLVAAAVVGLFAIGAAPAAVSDPSARMKQIVQSYVADKSFMGTVLVVKDGKTLLDTGFGSADLEWKIPNTPRSKLRLGSLTKQFTAASILLLQERGKLKVDDPICKYLPDAPVAWQKITIYNLLTHTSGIPNYTDFPDYMSLQDKPVTPTQIIARFRDKPLDFEPGSRYSYSNSGYIVLGYVIEKQSGRTYAKFLQQNIFTPLGMTNTGVDNMAVVLPDRAQGYQQTAQGLVHAGFIDMTTPFSAGDLYSTTGDLLKWERALFGGKLLKPASLTAMTTPFKANYAFGLVALNEHGHKRIMHDGSIDGFATSLNFYPDDKLIVIVLGNIVDEAPSLIANALGKVALGQSVTLISERKEVAVSPAVLAQYVGTYTFANGQNFVISLVGGKLVSTLGLQEGVPIYAESESRFFAKAVDAQVGFFRNPQSHAVDHLVLYQNDAEQLAKRAPARTTIVLAPAILATYAGVYQMDLKVVYPTGATEPRPPANVTVKTEGDHLAFQFGDGAPFVPIFAENEMTFYPKAVDAKVSFSRNAATHAITGIIYTVGGHDRVGKKLP